MSEEKKEPIVLWREQVDERIWFEAIEDDWGKAGRFVFLYCRARHPKREQVLQYQQAWSADEWAQAQESDYLHHEKARMLHEVRRVLTDLDAPEIHQQLTTTMQALAVRMFFDDSIFFQPMRFENLREMHIPHLLDIEHRIWEDTRIPVEEYSTWIAFSLPKRTTPEEIALFKRIADEAGNWFTWDTEHATWKFLPMRAWYKLHGEWRRQTRDSHPFWNSSARK